MDSLDLVTTFREVAGLGNFSRAAARLGIGKATASEHMAELEARFGIRLLNRSTRSVSLTDAGKLLLERPEPGIEMMESTASELHDRATKPAGRLRLSAPHGMSPGRFSKLLTQFLGHYPE